MTSPPAGEAGSRADFFVSFTRDDRAWAAWIAWQLEAVGSRVVFQDWDSRPGRDFVQWMHREVQLARHVLAILSPAYVASDSFAASERSAAVARDPTGELGILIPVRVADFQPHGLFAPRGYLDLVGLDAEEARAALLDGVRQHRRKPPVEPPFPGYPGALAPGEPTPRKITVSPPPPPFPGPELPPAEAFRQFQAAMRQLDEELQRLRGESPPGRGQRPVLEYRFLQKVGESLVILKCVDSANWRPTEWAMEFSGTREQAITTLNRTKRSPDGDFTRRMSDLMRALGQLREKVSERYPRLLDEQP
jgi:TIR domain